MSVILIDGLKTVGFHNGILASNAPGRPERRGAVLGHAADTGDQAGHVLKALVEATQAGPKRHAPAAAGGRRQRLRFYRAASKLQSRGPPESSRRFGALQGQFRFARATAPVMHRDARFCVFAHELSRPLCAKIRATRIADVFAAPNIVWFKSRRDKFPPTNAKRFSVSVPIIGVNDQTMRQCAWAIILFKNCTCPTIKIELPSVKVIETLSSCGALLVTSAAL